MSVQIIPKSIQTNGLFDNGAILEKKPIGFPSEISPLRAQSSLFYWAHAWSEPGGLIDLHPHRGYEILSIVLSGTIEHFDTKNRKWLPLQQGDVQIIRSGSGIQHAERILPHSSMFQIWFEPDLSKALQKPASYNDYRAKDFRKEQTEQGLEYTHICGANGILQMDTSACIYSVQTNHFSQKIAIQIPEKKKIQGTFVTQGSGSIQGKAFTAGDFILSQNEITLQIQPDPPSLNTSEKALELYCVAV